MVLCVSYGLYASLCCEWHYDSCFCGIVAISLILLRNVFDRIVKKWHGLWQYYKVTGVKSLRKAVSVDLCIVSMTFALLAVKYSLLDVNVVSWWIGFSTGLNILYHGCYKSSY